MGASINVRYSIFHPLINQRHLFSIVSYKIKEDQYIQL
jgi:hypothetical protein